jgi:uncharacterized membrane protein
LKKTSFSRSGIANEHGGSFRLPRLLEVFLVLLVVLELVAPFVTKNYGIDARFHLLWIDQFSKLNIEGILIPTWAPNGFYGFGAATFYFYPPLTYYVASAIHLLTGVARPTLLYQLTSVLATIASFFSAWALLRNLRAPRYQATLGALLYAFAPVRMFELYNRGALSSHLAYVFLPLIGLGMIGIARNPAKMQVRYILLLGISIALLALTNVPVTLATAVCIVIAILMSWKHWSRLALIETVVAALLATLLAAYHYMDVIAAAPFARLENLHFQHTAQDIRLWFHPGAGTDNLLIIYTLMGIVVISFGVARWKEELLSPTERMVARVGSIIAVFVFFLDCSPLSAWLWNSPLFLLIQIPWRFYPHLLLVATVFIGVASSLSLHRAAKGILWLTAFTLILPVAGVLCSWHSTNRLPEEDVAYAPNSVIRSGDVEAVSDSYRWEPGARSDLRSGEAIRKISSTVYNEEFETVLLTPHAITFHRFYWPFWHLYANGVEINSRPDSIGRATAELPTGHYTAIWRLERTPLERAGLWISGIAWSGVVIFSGIGLIRQRVRKKIPSQRDPNQSHSSTSPT